MSRSWSTRTSRTRFSPSAWRGLSERAIARRHGISARDVRLIVERLSLPIDHATRRRALQLEIGRLDKLMMKFYVMALQGDHAAAAIVIKLSERRGALWGMDCAPQRQDVVSVAPAPRLNSTEKIRAVFERVVSERVVAERPQQPLDFELLPPPDSLPN